MRWRRYILGVHLMFLFFFYNVPHCACNLGHFFVRNAMNTGGGHLIGDHDGDLIARCKQIFRQ